MRILEYSFAIIKLQENKWGKIDSTKENMINAMKKLPN